MSEMTTAERVEIGLILLVGLAVWLMASALPNEIGLGSLLLGSSAMLLFQGLLRDLWILLKRNGLTQSGQPQKMLCMCVESTIGVTGVVAGLVIFGSALNVPLSVDPWVWTALVISVLAIGFTIKDLVFELRPFRVRREKDHMNVVFSWKSNG